MNSKERVRRAITHQKTDRVPSNFECTAFVKDRLLKHYEFDNMDQLYDYYDTDIRPAYATYIGPELLSFIDDDGLQVQEDYWGSRSKLHDTGYGINGITCHYPLNEIDTVEGLLAYPWPKAEWFDYSSITETVNRYPDKAIIIGHPGPFQMATNLIDMEKLFMDMIINPDYAKTLFDKMVEFELAYYEKMFQAGEGKIDILRPHDDYGTQISLLFSVDMWRQYFKENTKKLTDLAHKYGAFYMQHSCGAVAPIIPELIDCGVDILEPLQKVNGLLPDQLKDSFEGKISFHGGIDTQHILPFESPEKVREEADKYINTLASSGGYILMSSQSIEGDVPIENIEALFKR